jgi:hypothetical protein
VTRAEQLLEGFKLGKLGAGRKLESDFKILNSGEDNKEFDLHTNTEIDLPYIFWRDTDNLYYWFAVDYYPSSGPNRGLDFPLFFAGGPNLVINQKPDNTGYKPKRFAWAALQYQSSLKMSLSEFSKLESKIRHEGINSLIPLVRNFEPRLGFEDKFYDWLKRKNAELKSR